MEPVAGSTYGRIARSGARISASATGSASGANTHPRTCHSAPPWRWNSSASVNARKSIANIAPSARQSMAGTRRLPGSAARATLSASTSAYSAVASHSAGSSWVRRTPAAATPGPSSATPACAASTASANAANRGTRP